MNTTGMSVSSTGMDIGTPSASPSTRIATAWGRATSDSPRIFPAMIE
jgi:hypothetical protein